MISSRSLCYKEGCCSFENWRRPWGLSLPSATKYLLLVQHVHASLGKRKLRVYGAFSIDCKQHPKARGYQNSEQRPWLHGRPPEKTNAHAHPATHHGPSISSGTLIFILVCVCVTWPPVAKYLFYDAKSIVEQRYLQTSFFLLMKRLKWYH